MADDRAPRVEKLTGKDNWATWRYVVKTILECDGLLDVCTKKQIKPELGEPNYAVELDRWSKANLKAKKLLVLSVNMEPLLRIEGCEMAHEIWDKLNQIYDIHSAENVDLLRHKLHEIWWQTTSMVESHLKEFDVIKTKMAQLKKDRKSTRLNSSHLKLSRMPSSA